MNITFIFVIINIDYLMGGNVLMERIAIIADVHSNIVALKAVMNDIESRWIKRIFCLRRYFCNWYKEKLGNELYSGGLWEYDDRRLSKVPWCKKKADGEENKSVLWIA